MRLGLLSCGAVFAVSLVAGAAAAQTAAPADATTVAAADKKEEKLICRNAPYTGTRLGAKKICKTRAEWDAASRSSRELMDKMQTNTMSSN